MFGLGLPEILLIVVVLVLLFGAKRIPELASGIGSGIRNFKKSMNEEEPDNNNKISKEK